MVRAWSCWPSWWCLVIILLTVIDRASGSVGDRSPYYLYCLENCVADNCSRPEDLARFTKGQSLSYKLTGWSCRDECGYECMWVTVAQFQEDDGPVPQFFGKWPFVRWAGAQEPASALFSLLNLASDAYMLAVLLVRLPENAPFKPLWITYALLAVVTWFWSAVFHTRDVGWTEKMDYLWAFSAVLFGLFCSLVRILGTDPAWRPMFVGLVLGSYLAWHVYYLTLVRMDYGYNMKANVVTGLASSVCWTSWSLHEYLVRGRTYVWRCVAVIAAAMALLSLELADFPPLWWTLDAHALWHLGTVPLPVLWTRFIVDDCRRLAEDKAKRKVI